MSFPFVDPLLISRLSRLPLMSQQAMLGNVSGRHRSLNHGSSAEFSEYRKYVQGDDIRMLDWKAYARSERHYIKQSESETNLLMHSMIDTSGSMRFGHNHTCKIALCKKLVATLSALAIKQGDAAGLHCISSDIDVQIPPRRKPSHLHQIYQTLATLDPIGSTGLCQGMHCLAENLPRRGMVLIFSDFFCELDELKDALVHLKHNKNDVVLFHILDESEINFNFSQAYRFVDLEDGSQLNIESPEIRGDYQSLMRDYLHGIKVMCSDIPVEYRLTLCSEKPEDILMKFLSSRHTRMQHS